jgi:hypothetical protein
MLSVAAGECGDGRFNNLVGQLAQPRRSWAEALGGINVTRRQMQTNVASFAGSREATSYDY